MYHDTAAAIESLNAMYGCATPSSTTRSDAQQAVHSRVVELIAEGRPAHVQQPREAARELLGDNFEYLGHNSRVVPFDSGEISLRGLRPPVDVADALGPGYARVLAEETLLADAEVLRSRRAEGVPTPYLDKVLWGGAAKRAGFVARRGKLGLVGFSTESRARVQPFFASKIQGRTIENRMGLPRRQHALPFTS